MARRNRRRADEARPLSAGFASRQRVGDYIVQDVSGARATKVYICPGCNQQIQPGVPHLVVWADHLGADSRRHWHRPCWQRRRP